MAARAPVALALVLALVGAVAPGARAQTGTATVQAVLDARVAAITSGDKDAWMATVDPDASKAFRDAQGRVFDGLRSVPIESYRLEARTEDTGDLSEGLDLKYGTKVQLPETRQRLRLKGYDDRDAVDSLWLTFVERGGTWYVGGDDDLAALGLDTARGLWDFAPIATLATEHLLTIYHPAQEERARALSAIAEDAIRTLDSRWDQPWSQRIPMVLPANTDELEKLLQSTIDLDKFLAFVSYGSVRDDGWEATAPRIYIQDENLKAYDRAYQVETLVHELTHAASAPLAGPFVSNWVHEGVADWIATGRSTKERKPNGSDGVLPRDFEFSTGSQTSIIRAYRESRSATSYLSSRRGLGAPSAFFRELGGTRVAAGNSDFQTDAALRRATGGALGLAELQTGWAKR